MTFIHRNTNSDLTGGSVNYSLLKETGTDASVTVSLAVSASVTYSAFTAEGVPGLGGKTGAYTVELRIVSGDTNAYAKVQLHRVDSDGTVQNSSTVSAEQKLNASRSYSFSDLNLGVWADGDRLRVDYIYRNASSMAAVSIDFGVNTVADEVITPFEEPVVDYAEGVGYAWAVGSGAVNVKKAVSGIGYAWEVGSGAITTLIQAIGSSFAWAVGTGGSIIKFTITGESFAWAVGSGAVSEDVDESEGAGQVWSVGGGEISRKTSVSGESFAWSVGEGNITAQLLVIGESFVWAVGFGDHVDTEISSGTGFAWSVGSGEVSVKRQTIGDGFAWSVADGAMILKALSNGEGFVWSVADGNGILKAETSGELFAWPVGEGTVEDLPVSGIGHVWAVGAGAASVLFLSNGEGFAWAVGSGDAESLLETTGTGYAWAVGAEGWVDPRMKPRISGGIAIGTLEGVIYLGELK